MSSTDDQSRRRAGQRITSLIELGRYGEAKAIIAAALATFPEDGDLYGALAQCHLALRDPWEALMAANACVHLLPMGEHGHRLRSQALLALDAYPEAWRAAREAVRLEPDNWLAHFNLALMRSEHIEERRATRDAADTACRLAPGEPDAHFAVGLTATYFDVEAARAAYERALAIDPSHAEARNNLAALGGQFRLRHAVEGFLGVLRLQPNLDAAHENLSLLAASIPIRISLVAVLTFLAAIPLSVLRASEVEPTGAWQFASITLCVLFVLGCAGWILRIVLVLPRASRRLFLKRIVQAGEGRGYVWVLPLSVGGAVLIASLLPRIVSPSFVIAVLVVITVLVPAMHRE